MNSTWPPYIPPVTSARVHDFLCAGKDHFAADRQVAEQIVVADPATLAMIDASQSHTRQALMDMALSGITQYVDLGCGLPRLGERSLHDLAQTLSPTARVTYVDHDLQVAVTRRAYHRGATGVSVVDGDLAHPAALLCDPALLSSLDMNHPVGVVCTLTLPYLRDAQVATLCAVLADTLPARSRLVITHPCGERAQAAAQAYRQGAATYGVQTYASARSQFLLESLLKGWTATVTAEQVGPLSALLTVTATRA